MGYDDGSWSAGDWFAMVAMMLLFWGAVIGLVVWAVRSSRSGGERRDINRVPAERPDDVLAERYARGEIDEEEFRRRRELLRSTAASPSEPRRTP